MAKFILKNWYGKDQTFNEETIYVQGADGELMPFTHGAGNPVIEPLNVTENGTYEVPDGVDGFGPVTVNIPDPTKVLLREESEITGFGFNSTYGYMAEEVPAPFTLEVGKTYYVAWDGTTYEVTGQDASALMPGAVYIGDGSIWGLTPAEVPFIIGYINEGIAYSAINDPAASHTVGIWQKKESSGSCDDVRYVTFMSYDGLIEYGKKAVAVGDDCADPIARGVFATPTRESDVQYNYTFYGWATAPNGGADANALKAVTEDKTVYANFSATVRTYTITYFDSDGTTVLKTESLPYGTIPGYTPVKDKHSFSGWNPAPVAVAGEASYTAVWVALAGFAIATWEEISEITTAGTSNSAYAVGDTREEYLTYSDGSTEKIELVIAKIRDDGTMVLALNCALATEKPMHSQVFNASGDYFSNDLGIYLTNTVYPALPEALKTVVRPVRANYSDRLIRLPTGSNLYRYGETSYTDAQYEQLPLFATAANRIRRKIDGTAVTYWNGDYTKSGSYYYFHHVSTEGVLVDGKNLGGTGAVTGNRGIVFLIDV